MIKNISAHPINDAMMLKMQKEISIEFHRVQPHGPNWMNRGVQQWPLDLFTYQELMVNLKPNVVIETGTAGGSVPLFLNDIYHLMQLHDIAQERFIIITVDINLPTLEFPDNIKFIQGNSIDEEIVEQVKDSILPTDKVLVMLDSDHGISHVNKELEIYSSMVTKGSYIIAEDTSLDLRVGGRGGPYQATVDFLQGNNKFIRDHYYERWYTTQHPQGFLKRVQ